MLCSVVVYRSAYANDIIVTWCHYTDMPVSIYMAGMKNDYFRSQFRLPNDLYERLKAEAEKGGRSLNGEIVARLEASFEPGLVAQVAQLLDEQTARIVEEIRRGGS